MSNTELISKVREYVISSENNYVSKHLAIFPEIAGMQIYEEPIFGFAAANDSIFTVDFKKPGVIHPDYQSPLEWLPEAKTVISFFLPFTKRVKDSNKNNDDVPYEEGLPQHCSTEWLHARIEGQALLNEVTDYISKLLTDGGYKAVCPTTSENFKMLTPTISVWSERHAAYAAGLGTFGLSKGLITEKGMCGRFGSVITDAVFEVTPRPYSDPFEYCNMCGACMRKCPAGAIDVNRGCALGKDQQICSAYVHESFLPPQGPKKIVRYGCGKCQVSVPCENGIPKKKRN